VEDDDGLPRHVQELALTLDDQSVHTAWFQFIR
jgi:hypothetical protein